MEIYLSREKPIMKPFKTELDETEFEYIISTLLHMIYAMDRSPSTFNRLSEEKIRYFFLISLNSHYE